MFLTCFIPHETFVSLNGKATPDFDNSHRVINGMKELLYATICMLEATFCLWLWNQLS